MTYILSPLSIATSGYIGPIPDTTDQCPAPIAIGTHGYIRFGVASVVTGGKMADPWVGHNRFREPFDRGYYRWKYPKPVPRETIEPEPEPVDTSAERARDLEARGKRRATAHAATRAADQAVIEEQQQARARRSNERKLTEELAALETRNRSTAEDIRELESYIEEVASGLESGLAEKLAAEERTRDAQVALIARLEQNVAEARETLVLALEKQRRQRNQHMAIEAVIKTYY